MRKLCLLLCILGLIVSGCSTPEMAVEPGLRSSAEMMFVKGRQGWMQNQHLSFGQFASSKVQRGWTKSYDIPFIIRFQGAKEKLSFTLNNGGSNEAEVMCLGKMTQQELMILGDMFRVPLKMKDVFSATIIVNQGQSNWSLVVYNPNDMNITTQSSGFLTNQDQTFEITEVRKLHEKKTLINPGILGYEFQINGKAVAAVQTINNGIIWLSPDLPDDLKLVLASASAALLLRSDLSETAE